jgi:hypothetical protein
MLDRPLRPRRSQSTVDRRCWRPVAPQDFPEFGTAEPSEVSIVSSDGSNRRRSGCASQRRKGRWWDAKSNMNLAKRTQTRGLTIAKLAKRTQARGPSIAERGETNPTPASVRREIDETNPASGFAHREIDETNPRPGRARSTKRTQGRKDEKSTKRDLSPNTNGFRGADEASPGSGGRSDDRFFPLPAPYSPRCGRRRTISPFLGFSHLPFWSRVREAGGVNPQQVH